jgi:hypothetical protein
MSPQQIYSLHVPLAVALLVLTALFAAVESFRRRR